MLVVKTFTGPDVYGGTGLFAGENIPKGKTVWLFHRSKTKFFSIEEYFSAAPTLRARLDRFAYPFSGMYGGKHLTGLWYDLDDASYTNHSDEPNTWDPPPGEKISVASRDIARGEPITWNYRLCDPDNVVHNLGVLSCKSFLLPARSQPLWADMSPDTQESGFTGLPA